MSDSGIDTRLINNLFGKVRAIKSKYPDASKGIDRLEVEIRDRIEAIHGYLRHFDEHDRDLVAALVINGIAKSAEEILGSEITGMSESES